MARRGLVLAAATLLLLRPAPCCGDNTRDSLKPLLRCTACERVVSETVPFATRLLQEDRKWTKSLGKELMDHMSSRSCGNQEVFAANSGLLLEGCIDFMTNYFSRTRKAFRKRFDPRFAEFGEDIEPKVRRVGARRTRRRRRRTTRRAGWQSNPVPAHSLRSKAPCPLHAGHLPRDRGVRRR